MSKPRNTLSQSRQIARRAWLPLASTAAAVSLVSCAMSGPDERLAPTPLPPAPPASAPVTGAAIVPAAAATAPADRAAQIERYAERVTAALQKQPATTEPAAAGGGGERASLPVTSSVPPAPTATPAAPNAHVTATPAPAHGDSGASVPAVAPVAAPATAPAPTASASAVHPEGSAGTGQVAAMTPMAATAPAAVEATTQSAPALTDDSSLDPLLDVLRKRVQAHPQAIQYALALQLLESSEHARAADPANLAGLSPTDQKFVSELSGAVLAAAAKPAGTATSVADRAAPIAEAARTWQADDDLKLPRLVLTSRVDSFGVYTPVEPKFETGKKHVVIIYCEVTNFTTVKGDDGIYQTRLAQQDSLITDDSLLVWRPNPEEVEDRSRNQRRDFYLVKKLTIPDTLAVGKYTLRMSVTDKLSNKIAVVAMPIEITAAK
jgi:hypothetical protein